MQTHYPNFMVNSDILKVSKFLSNYSSINLNIPSFIVSLFTHLSNYLTGSFYSTCHFSFSCYLCEFIIIQFQDYDD